jgi:hypothetical protein
MVCVALHSILWLYGAELAHQTRTDGHYVTGLVRSEEVDSFVYLLPHTSFLHKPLDRYSTMDYAKR